MKVEETVCLDEETARELAELASQNGMTVEEQLKELVADFCVRGGYPPKDAQALQVH